MTSQNEDATQNNLYPYGGHPKAALALLTTLTFLVEVPKLKSPIKLEQEGRTVCVANSTQWHVGTGLLLGGQVPVQLWWD